VATKQHRFSALGGAHNMPHADQNRQTRLGPLSTRHSARSSPSTHTGFAPWLCSSGCGSRRGTDFGECSAGFPHGNHTGQDSFRTPRNARDEKNGGPVSGSSTGFGPSECGQILPKRKRRADRSASAESRPDSARADRSASAEGRPDSGRRRSPASRVRAGSEDSSFFATARAEFFEPSQSATNRQGGNTHARIL